MSDPLRNLLTAIGADDLKMAVALIAAAVTKWLLTEEVPQPGETRDQRRRRWLRSVGGIMFGMLLGYYGNGTVIRMFSVLTPEDDLIVAVLLVVTGEHLYRAALGNIDGALRKLGGGKGK